MQLISQVLRAVKAPHGAGYAHCNIKPSNILRRLQQHDCILCDLACAATLGAHATLPAGFCRCICRCPANIAHNSNWDGMKWGNMKHES